MNKLSEIIKGSKVYWKPVIFIFLFAGFMSSGLNLFAATIDIYAESDCYTDSALPDSNFGLYNYVSVIKDQRKAYLKFNRSLIPEGEITSIELFFYATVNENLSFSFSAVIGSWNETGLTYNTMPPVAGGEVSLFIPAVNSIYSIDLTSLKTELLSVTEPSVCITSDSLTASSIASRESGITLAPYFRIGYIPAGSTPTCTVTVPPEIMSPTVTPTQTIFLTPSISEALDQSGLIFTTGGNAVWSYDSGRKTTGNYSMRSGPIDDNETTYIQAEVTGPCIISFDWMTDCEYSLFGHPSPDGIAFYVNSVGVDGADSRFPRYWIHRDVTVNKVGIITLKWIYYKDDSYALGQDCAWLDNVQYLYVSPTISPVVSPTPTCTGTPTVTSTITKTATATITPTWTKDIEIARAVDCEELDWYTAGSGFPGVRFYSQNSETVFDNDAVVNTFFSQHSVVVWTYVNGPGYLTYNRKTVAPDNRWQFVFYVDTYYPKLEILSGTNGWEEKTYYVSPGQHSVWWRYDNLNNIPQAAYAYLDHVRFVYGTPTMIASATSTPTITDTITVTSTVTNTITVTLTKTITPTRTPKLISTIRPTFTETNTIFITTPTITCTPTPGIEDNKDMVFVPNPIISAGKQEELSFFGINRSFTIRIYDISGRLNFKESKKWNGGIYKLRLNGVDKLPPGLYLYYITTEDKKTIKGKFVVR